MRQAATSQVDIAVLCVLRPFAAVSQLLVGPASPMLGSVLVENSSFPFVGEYSFAVRSARPSRSRHWWMIVAVRTQFWVYLTSSDGNNLPVLVKANGWGDAMNPFVYLYYNTCVGSVIGEPCMQCVCVCVLLRRLTVYSSCSSNAFNGVSLSVATQVWTHVSFAHGANGVLQVSALLCCLLASQRCRDVAMCLVACVGLCCAVMCFAAGAGLREWRADSVCDVRRAADVQLWCVALGEIEARMLLCVCVLLCEQRRCTSGLRTR